MIEFILLALFIFADVAIGDWVWARYGMAVAARQPHRAAIFAVGIVLVGALSVLIYTTNHWMVLPAAAGAWVGTFFTVRKHRPEPEPFDLEAEIGRVKRLMDEASGIHDISRGQMTSSEYEAIERGWL